MRPASVFVCVVALLATTLLAQLMFRYWHKPRAIETFAVWKDNPANIAAARALAKRVVTGKVAKIERAEDLVIKAPGELENEVRIPIEAVTIEVEKTLKGGPARTIQVFHTGSSVGIPVVGRPEPPASERPPRPPQGVERPKQMKEPYGEEARTVILHDDPPYEVGQRYVLLLTDGPTVRISGVATATQRVISPSGRYFITPENNLEPAARSGFALKLRGKPLRSLELQMRPQSR